MARSKRQWHSKGYYHIIMRGNNRQQIFFGAPDMNEYFRIIDYVYNKYQFEIYAYCIMSNHIHLLLSSPNVPLGKLMSVLNKRYSDYFRIKHKYTGQIYENRYFSKEITNAAGLLNVGAYIHRNPIETKVPMVKKMEDYAFSSHKYYHYNHLSPYIFLNLTLLPSLLPVGVEKNAREYANYCVAQPQQREELKQ